MYTLHLSVYIILHPHLSLFLSVPAATKLQAAPQMEISKNLFGENGEL